MAEVTKGGKKTKGYIVVHGVGEGEKRVIRVEPLANAVEAPCSVSDVGGGALRRFEADGVSMEEEDRPDRAPHGSVGGVVEDAFAGRPVTVLTIGSEGSLVWTVDGRSAYLRQVVAAILERMQSISANVPKASRPTLALQLFEIYKDTVIDLLTKKKIVPLEPPGDTPRLPGISSMPVRTPEEFDDTLQIGLINATKTRGAQRSHLFFRALLQVPGREKDQASTAATSSTAKGRVHGRTSSALASPLVSGLLRSSAARGSTAKANPTATAMTITTTTVDVVALAPFLTTNKDFLTQDQQDAVRSLVTLGHQIDRINGKTTNAGLNWRSTRLTQMLRPAFTTNSTLVGIAHTRGTHATLQEAIWMLTLVESIREVGIHPQRVELGESRISERISASQLGRQPSLEESVVDEMRKQERARTQLLEVHAETVQDLQKRLKAAEKERADAEAQLKEQLRGERDKVASLKRTADELRGTLESRDKEVALMKKAVEEMRAECHAKVEELNDALRERTEGFKETMDRQEAIIDKQNAALRDLQKQVPLATSALAESTLKKSHAKSRADADPTLDELEAIVMEQQRAIDELAKHVASVEERPATSADDGAAFHEHLEKWQESIAEIRRAVAAELEAYKRDLEGKASGSQEGLKIARTIADTYIRQGAKRELNISSDARVAVLRAVDSPPATKVQPGLFIPARREVLQLLRQNKALVRFQESQELADLRKSGKVKDDFATVDAILANKGATAAFREFLRQSLHAEENADFLTEVATFDQIAASAASTNEPPAAVSALEEAIARLTHALDEPIREYVSELQSKDGSHVAAPADQSDLRMAFASIGASMGPDTECARAMSVILAETRGGLLRASEALRERLGGDADADSEGCLADEIDAHIQLIRGGSTSPGNPLSQVPTIVHGLKLLKDALDMLNPPMITTDDGGEGEAMEDKLFPDDEQPLPEEELSMDDLGGARMDNGHGETATMDEGAPM